MDDKLLKFREVKTEKKKFHSSKKAVDVNCADTEKILPSAMRACGRNKETDAKYF